jgi:hypothetical protein
MNLVYDPLDLNLSYRPKGVWVSDELLELVNKMRSEKGLPPVKVIKKDDKEVE